MEIRENDATCIFTPLDPILGKLESKRLLPFISQEKREVALDLSMVSDCTIGFIEGLKEISQKKNIGIFNIPQDMFVLFNVMGIDKSIKLFVSELDFLDNTRRLINRKFTVI